MDVTFVFHGDPGIDYCEEAEIAKLSDSPLDPKHIAECLFCKRRDRMNYAAFCSYEPLEPGEANLLLQAMVDEFVGKPRTFDSETMHRFYALLAADTSFEILFATCVEAELNPIESTARFVDLEAIRSENEQA